MAAPFMRTRRIVLAAALCSGVMVVQPRGLAQSPCRPDGAMARIRELREGSGIAASRSRPGLLWAHNDSSAPMLVALDEQGTVTGQIRVAGAQVDDWEDIAVASCPRGSCIYIGDIGDNKAVRRQITVYRVPEPAAGATTTEAAEVFHARYPDGPQDAESLFVTPDGVIVLVTKGDPGPVAVYRFPRPLAAGTVVPLERVGNAVSPGRTAPRDRPTAADMSPEGRWVAMRTSDYLALFATGDFLAGRWKESHRVDLRGLKEGQGEGVTFGRDGRMFLLGEGARGGTFARLECTFSK
jgi:hypothetical protein